MDGFGIRTTQCQATELEVCIQTDSLKGTSAEKQFQLQSILNDAR